MATVEQQPQQSQGDTDGGAPRDTIRVENPATGEAISEIPSLSKDEVKGLVDRARAAQPGWEALGFEGRGSVLRDLRKWIVDNRHRVIQKLCDENGKPWEDAQVELFYTVDSLGFWAKHARKFLRDERASAHSPLLLGRKLISRFRPYGVVGVIGPWNYPLINNFGDSIPALAAGNSVVLKPSSVTPLTSLLIQEGWRAVGAPEDAFLVATGPGKVGGALVETVDMLHFTGSTGVGKMLMEQGSERLLPLTLELGGNDPMIVLEDANIERAANAAVWGAMQNGGQTCISIERVYVEGDAYYPFVQKVVEKVRDLRQGVPGGPGDIDIGAVTYSDQLDTLEEH